MESYNRSTYNGLIIDFKELIWRILEQWKAVVVFVIIIMLLFSAFMYSRNTAAYEAKIEAIHIIHDQQKKEYNMKNNFIVNPLE